MIVGIFWVTNNDLNYGISLIDSDIPEGTDAEHLNDYFEELADDLVNLTVDEIEDAVIDEVIDSITQD